MSSTGHSPELQRRPDGRYEVRCRECEHNVDRRLPLGIGVPLSDRAEAESVLEIHRVQAA